MEVCVLVENYGNFGSSYGAPYPDGAEMQVTNAQWSPANLDGVTMTHWQEQVLDRGLSNQWPGSSVSGEWASGNTGPVMQHSGPVMQHSVWVSNGDPNIVLPHGPPLRDGYTGNTTQHAARPKRRFCMSYPEAHMCRRGSSCVFAHARNEICAPLLDTEEERQDPAFMTDEFFMLKYKTHWCPIGVQHDWHTCVYAHNYQDARRPVSIGYGARLCPYWSKKDTGAEYSQRCPLGLRCPYSHGAKEQLYHPQYFKTVICRDLRGKACPRQGLCAFFHHRHERRPVPANESVDYTQPLHEEAFDNDWIMEFLSPPFLPELNKESEETQMDGSNMAMATYDVSQVPAAPYGMQQMPTVFLCPMPQMGAAQMVDMGDPMCSPMGNQMPSPMGNWVFVPVDSQ